MPPSPSQAAQLCLAIRSIIAARAGVSVADVRCDGSLAGQPLLLTADQLERLSAPFQDAAREIDKSASVSASETSKLDDVLSAYNLVGKKVGLAKLTCKETPPVPRNGVRGLKAILGVVPVLGAALGFPEAMRAQSVISTIVNTMEVRQNTDVKNLVARNATFSIIAPDSGAATFTLNAGVLFDLWSRTVFSLSALAGWNRNTAVGEGQNQWDAGLTGGFRAPRILLALDPNFRLTVRFADDVKAGTSAVRTSLLISATGDGNSWRPNTTIQVDRCLPITFTWSPWVGAEFDRKISGPDVAPGNFLRLIGRIDAVARLGQPTEPTIEFSTTNAFRRDLRDQSVAGQNANSFHAVSGTYYFARTTRVLAGVSLSHTWGEDPTRGFAHQAFTEFGLALRITAKPGTPGVSYPPEQCQHRR